MVCRKSCLQLCWHHSLAPHSDPPNRRGFASISGNAQWHNFSSELEYSFYRASHADRHHSHPIYRVEALLPLPAVNMGKCQSHLRLGSRRHHEEVYTAYRLQSHAGHVACVLGPPSVRVGTNISPLSRKDCEAKPGVLRFDPFQVLAVRHLIWCVLVPYRAPFQGSYRRVSTIMSGLWGFLNGSANVSTAPVLGR